MSSNPISNQQSNEDDDLDSFHDLSAKSKLTPDVIADALKAWQQHAPDEFKNLVEAEIEDDNSKSAS
jgi:hypothetical protein